MPITALPPDCTDDRSWGSVTCPAPAGVSVDAGDGEDIVRLGWGVAVPVAVAGGPGPDLLEGDEGADALDGGPGDDDVRGHGGGDVVDGGEGADEVEGGAGGDRVAGGTGDDILRPDGVAPPSADVVDGGDGFDRVEGDWDESDVNAPRLPLSVTLGDGADDGRPGEGDDVRSVEALVVHSGGRLVARTRTSGSTCSRCWSPPR